jgi:excisionase family DNA binding protein
MPDPLSSRFLTIPGVAEELATSPAQIRALIRRRELPALQIGGRGQWRVERAKLEEYIEAAYEATQRELERRRRGAPADPDSDYTSTDEDADYRQEEGGES